MKKLILISALLFSFNGWEEENEMVPLRDYISGDFSGEDNELLYLSYRCLGLYGMMWGLMQDAPQDGAADTLKDFEEAQLQLHLMAEYLYNRLTPVEKRDYIDNVTRSVLPMADNYQKEANRSWTNSGSYFNEYILDDAYHCKTMIESFANGSNE